MRKDEVERGAGNWDRLAPLLLRCFPELEATNGRIRSDLIELKALREALGYGAPEFGRLFVKNDGALPLAGSIKARGGLYEVFIFAERLAREHGVLTPEGEIASLADEPARSFFAEHKIVVGSTGNLGLSVGVAARALGFRCEVHMSSDAKPWKVERLKRLGVDVIEHQCDYTSAVASARQEADADPKAYFVDDEHSQDLFFGYSAAARELAEQLRSEGIRVDADHPLFLYLPCGIGGAPGGTTFGAKAIFGDHVHCFFVQPVQSPCVIVQLMSGATDLVSVYDVGLTNRTEADGMAVARMSGLVGEIMRPMLSGAFTVEDDDLFRWLHMAWTSQGIRLEPSATAGFAGPDFIVKSEEGKSYLRNHGLSDKLADATHIVWTTGGMFVPEDQFSQFLTKRAGSIRAS